MEIAEKQLRSGFTLPSFGIGSWMLGGDSKRDPANDGERDRASIRAAIDAGIYHIDTAEVYAEGYAERLIGDVIQDYDRRLLRIVSKVWESNFQYDQLIRAAKASLERLRTPYLDLYLLHRAPSQELLSESMRALDTLVDEGLIRAIGVSNFTVERMKQAQDLSRHKIVATQVHYNLIYREVEHAGVLEYCQRNDLLCIAWRPIEKGALSGDGSALLQTLCKKYGKTPAQISLNWLVSQNNVVTLSTMRTLAHLKENLGAFGWSLDASDIELLRREFPGQQVRSNSVPLS